MKLSEVQHKKILLSCLNWGMGHVSRSIGLIRKLESQNNVIYVAGDPDQLKVFKIYFPAIQTIELPGYPFEFEKYNSFIQAIWHQKWKLKKFLNFETKWVNKITKALSIDLVIADHRYGFKSSNCASIFVTHQIHLPLRGVYNLFHYFHLRWMKQFDAVWIVDEPINRLSGKLSHYPNHPNFEYIGWLSRFENNRFSLKNQKKNQSVLLLSGPGNYLNYLHEYFVLNANHEMDQIVIGKTSALASLPKDDRITYIDSRNWLEIDEILIDSREIFSFFGYSTLMDAKYLSAKFHLLPCPGQWEQEYLSSIHPKIFNEK